MLPKSDALPNPSCAFRQGRSVGSWTALLLPAVALALALGCGGSGSAPSAQMGGSNSTADSEGIYTGTVVSASDGHLTAYAAITPAGQIHYVSSNTGVASALISSGSGTFYIGGGHTALTLTNVTVTPAASVGGNFALAAGDTGTFAFTYNSVYLRVPTRIAGSYQASPSRSTTGATVNLIVDASGNVTGGDYTGTITQLNASKNLYQVNLTSTTTSNTFLGLGFWTDTASGMGDGYLYLQVAGVNNTTALGAVLVPAT